LRRTAFTFHPLLEHLDVCWSIKLGDMVVEGVEEIGDIKRCF
jgi:hypothetical protein